MRAVGNCNWGFDKKTLTLTYNTLIKPTFSQCAPVWAPNVKPTNVKGLQTVRNRGLRIIIGCHQAASEDHLHSEVEILPVQDHLDMISKQFLVSALRPAHPSHEVVRRLPGPRKNKCGRPLKETLSSKYGPSVEKYLQNGVMSEVFYYKTLQAIHTEAVSDAKKKQRHNPLIQCHPPAVSASEGSLPRRLPCLDCGPLIVLI
jgi:REP element-mobilizing transposase RayT